MEPNSSVLMSSKIHCCMYLHYHCESCCIILNIKEKYELLVEETGFEVDLFWNGDISDIESTCCFLLTFIKSSPIYPKHSEEVPNHIFSAQVGSSVLCTPKNRCFLRMKSLNQKDGSFLKFQNIQCGDKSFIGDKRIS